MQWYYIDSGQQTGPITEQDFAKLVKAGTIDHKTLVWQEGFENWVFYGDLLASQKDPSNLPDDGTRFCCECGQAFPVNELVPYEELYVCANCKNIFFQRLREGAAIPGRMLYAGFWIRFGAKIIDGIILSVFNQMLQFGLTFATMSLQQSDPTAAIFLTVAVVIIQLAVTVTFYTFFVGRFGATPGKMACKLKIVRSDGSKVTYGRAFGRYFAEMLSQIILYIGYIMVAFDDEKRALHDRICDTRVVKVG